MELTRCWYINIIRVHRKVAPYPCDRGVSPKVWYVIPAEAVSFECLHANEGLSARGTALKHLKARRISNVTIPDMFADL